MLGTPSNIYSTAVSSNCAKFGTFVNSVTFLKLRDLTISSGCIVMVLRSDNASRGTATGSDFYPAFGLRMHKSHRPLMLTFRKIPDLRARGGEDLIQCADAQL